MSVASSPTSTRPRWSTVRTIGTGALLVGTIDLLDALVFFGVRGVPSLAILQSIASGLLGAAAYQGGAASAALGLALHFLIAGMVVLVYHVAARRLPALRRTPWLWGPLYGLAVYVVMNEVVLPLSAAATGPRPFPVLMNGLLIHALGVGLPSALVVAAGMRNGAGAGGGRR